MRISILTPADFSFYETVSAHGWRRLLPFVWNEEAQTLSRTEDMGNGRLVQLEMSGREGEVRVETDTECDEQEIAARIRCMLQIDLPLNEFHAYCKTRPELARIADRGQGRMLRSPTVFEDVLKVIATTNTTWAQTIAMSARLVGEFGTGGQAFPSAVQIAAVSFEQFAAKARMGYRSAYVYAIAAAITDGTLDLESWPTETPRAADLRKRLLALPGIGPYGAACLMLYLGRPEHVNADSVARSLLAGELGRPVTDKEVYTFFEAHGQWRGLIYNFYPWKKIVA